MENKTPNTTNALTQTTVTRTNVVSPDDIKELEKLTVEAHQGLNDAIKGTFKAVESLLIIQKRKLYRCMRNKNGNQLYMTFGDFLQDEFGCERSYFCQMKNAYLTKLYIEENFGQNRSEVLKAIPENVSNFYELSKIPRERLDEALTYLISNVANDQMTRSHIAQWRKSNCPTVRTTSHDVIDVASSNHPADPETAENNATGTSAADGEKHATGNLPVAVPPTPSVSQESPQATTGDKNDEIERDDHDDEEEEKDDDDEAENEDEEDEEDTPYEKGQKKFEHIYRLLNDSDLIEYMAKDPNALPCFIDRFKEAQKRMMDYISEDDLR